MRHQQRRRGRCAPPYIDKAFAQALSGNRELDSDRHRKVDHKTAQLCRQVQRALNLELGANPALDGLYVENVTAAPGPAHLLVHLTLPGNLTVSDVLARLEILAPRLRAEVARTITRKRAPQLTFVPTTAAAGGTNNE